LLVTLLLVTLLALTRPWAHTISISFHDKKIFDIDMHHGTCILYRYLKKMFTHLLWSTRNCNQHCRHRV
jgi:hypothetical protein